MHIAFDGGHDDFSFGLDVLSRGGLLAFFFFDVRHQVRHRLLHHTRGLDHLGQEHLALAKQIAHHVHAIHEWPLDHMQGASAFGKNGAVRLFGVFVDEVGDAMHQGMAEPLRHGHWRLRRATPGQFLAVVFGGAFGAFGHFNQTLARVGTAVKHHIFHALAQSGL